MVAGLTLTHRRWPQRVSRPRIASGSQFMPQPTNGPAGCTPLASAGGVFTSLDVLRNIASSCTFGTSHRWWHRADWMQRAATWSALHESKDPAHWRRADRLRDCGRYMQAAATESGSVKLLTKPCRNRACPTCSRMKAKAVERRIIDMIGAIDTPRLLTLTIVSQDKPLAEQIDHLWESYRRLRKSKLWRESQRGAVACIEVTLNLKTRRWHPHLHCVIDGDYLPQSAWSRQWKLASEGSAIVDVRLIRSKQKAASYVASYLSKNANTHRWSAAEILESIDAFHGRRQFNASGSLRKFNSGEVREIDKCAAGEVLITPDQLKRMREHRADITAPIYSDIASLGPMWCLVFGAESDDPRELSDGEVTAIKARLRVAMSHAVRLWWHFCETGCWYDVKPHPKPPPHPELFPPPSSQGD